MTLNLFSLRFLLLLFVSHQVFANAHAAQSSSQFRVGPTNDEVSVNQLLKNPNRYAGKRIEVNGVYLGGFETNALHDNNRRAGVVQSSSGVWLEGSIPESCYGNSITVSGTFDPVQSGHLSAYKGQIVGAYLSEKSAWICGRKIEKSCSVLKHFSLLSSSTVDVIKHSFTPRNGNEALEILKLRSGVSVEILHRGCEYSKLQIVVESPQFALIKSDSNSIYKAASEMFLELSKYQTKPIHAFSFDKIAEALFAVKLEENLDAPPTYPPHSLWPITFDNEEGVPSSVKIVRFLKNSGSGIFVIDVYREKM